MIKTKIHGVFDAIKMKMKKNYYLNVYKMTEISDIFQYDFQKQNTLFYLTFYKDIKVFYKYSTRILNVNGSEDSVIWKYGDTGVGRSALFRQRFGKKTTPNKTDYISNYFMNEAILSSDTHGGTVSITLNYENYPILNDKNILFNFILFSFYEFGDFKEELVSSALNLNKKRLVAMLKSIYSHHSELNFNLNDFTEQALLNQTKERLLNVLFREFEKVKSNHKKP